MSAALPMVHRARIAQFALTQRLPSMFGWTEYCEAGGLLSYGANQRATYFSLAIYADRILRGQSPAGLPVVQPTKFELAVNLKTARMLGIDLDTSFYLVPRQQGDRMRLVRCMSETGRGANNKTRRMVMSTNDVHGHGRDVGAQPPPWAGCLTRRGRTSIGDVGS